MSIKDNATAHFRAKLSGELLSIDVPEWEDKIYYKGAVTGKQQTQIFKLYSQDKQIEAVYMSLIMRALDEDGKPIWRSHELNEMMRSYDPDVVSRLVEEISNDEPTVDEVKKP
jgi:hypothetical protein